MVQGSIAKGTVGSSARTSSAKFMILLQKYMLVLALSSYFDLGPLSPAEVGQSQKIRNRLWLRGGFPESFTAPDDEVSREWRDAFIKTYLERDIPKLGTRVPAETLRRFCTMLAHNQGALLMRHGWRRASPSAV